MPGVISPKGIPVMVPATEAVDARLLADDLIAQMQAGEA